MEPIKSISGIRGIVGKTLTEKHVEDFVHVFCLTKSPGKLLIGRDTRLTGKTLLESAAREISMHKHTDVDICGIIPTPTGQFLVQKHKYAGGIIFTASHNPSEWNGMKFIDRDGCFINQDRLNEMLNQYPPTHIGAALTKIPCLEKINKIDDPIKEHIENVINLSIINKKNIKNKKFKVVIDACNGAAYEALPRLAKMFGCEVIKINCSNDSDFGRNPEPTPENLDLLSKTVLEHKADLGFATDPDGDRLSIVDEKGKAIGEEYTLSLCYLQFLNSNSKSHDMCTNLSTSQTVDHIAKKFNAKVLRSSVGEINVVNKMKEYNIPFGGEGNGGIILEESHLGRDSLVGMAMVLDLLAKKEHTISKIIDSIPKYHMLKDKIKLTNYDKGVFDSIIKEYSDAKCDLTDGIKLIWDESWIHIRKSNTEPIIRIIAESPSHSLTKKLISRLKSSIEKYANRI